MSSFAQIIRIVFIALLMACSTASPSDSKQYSVSDNHPDEYCTTKQSAETLPGQLHLQLTKQSRTNVSHKALFQGMTGQGYMTLCADQNVTLDIIVNQQPIKKNLTLNGKKPLTLDIRKYSRAGSNYLHFANLSNIDTTISARIPYPILTNPSEAVYDFSAVDRLINADINAGFPGAVLAVIKDGKLIKHQAYGYALRYSKSGEKLSKPEPVRSETLFDLASNTKMYATNYALMKLMSQGLLDVNKPINDYLPEYQGEGRESRLVKDLLQHSAGYAPSTAFYDRERTGTQGLYSQDPQLTRKLVVEAVPFKTQRRQKVVYSDNDYILLGILVEKITGEPLDSYVEKNIYQPLGLPKVRFNPLQKGFSASDIAATELAGNSRDGRVQFDNIRTEVIRGEVHDEKAFYSMAGVAGHAGLFANAQDIAKLALILLNRGGLGEVQLFSADVLDQFFKPSDLNMTMGLGWRRAGNASRTWQFGPYASPYAFGHTGWTGTVTIIDPKYNLVIVLLTNKKHSPIIEEDGQLKFIGDGFETGKYGSVVTLIYEAILMPLTGTH